MLKLFGVSKAIPILLAAIFFAHSSFAFDPTVSPKRPKIGLALSGGGARGAAHVGVLKVLEEMRIPIDYIAGTSMGSIIGGLYASGMTPEQIEQAVAEMDWENIFSDAPPRSELSYRRKRDDDLYMLGVKPGYKEGKLEFSTGAIQGQKFDLALRHLTMPVRSITNFDELYIPFRAIASDIGAGRKVVLGAGDLATALRASMSVPGVFAATKIDGKLLVDGGITANLPINEVREMGADIVIAVDIGSPSMEAEHVTNLFKITSQLISIMTRSNVEQQIATLTEKDILLVPELGNFSSMNFVESLSIVPLGRKKAEEHRDELSKLSLTEKEYRVYLDERPTRPNTAIPVIQFVEIKNNSTVSDEMIRARIHQSMDAPLDRAQLEKDIGAIYGLDLFQTVHYDLVEKNGETGLNIAATAKSWGPDYLQFGLKLSSDQRGKNKYSLGGSYLRTGINPLGGELRFGVQLGEEAAIAADWHQPLGMSSRYFGYAGARYGAQNIDLYDIKGNERLAEFRVKEASLELAAGREIGAFGEIRLGYQYAKGDVDLNIGDPFAEYKDYSYNSGSVFGRLSFDRLDNYNFPTDGWLTRLEYNVYRNPFGADEEFDQLSILGNRFQTFGDGHVLGFFGSIDATTDGTAAIQDRFTLGGLFNLSGYSQGALSGQEKGILGTMYFKRTELLPFLSWYLGGSLEYGGVWENKEDLFDHNAVVSGSLFVGADTPLGPLYIGFGIAEGGSNALFFSLGRPNYQ